jgi:hypothetical protein
MKQKLKLNFMKYANIVLILIFITSCNNSEEEHFVFNPHEFSENKFSLSMIAEDVNYIPLDDSIPIESIYSMRINKRGIFLSTKNPGILHLDFNGKYVCIIAHKGRGPGEYHYGMNFTVDEKNEMVFVVDRQKIKLYSLNGNFVRDISTKEFIYGTAGGIEIFNSRIFLADYGTYGDFKFNWIVLDTLGNLIAKKYNTIQPLGSMISGRTYNFKNKLFYYNYLNDTIFTILPDLQFKAAYLFSKGDFRWPDNLVLKSLSQGYKLFKPGCMFETKNYIFMEYSFQDRWAILLIDKKTKKMYQGYKEKKIGIVNYAASILNDIDGGLPSSPEHSSYFYYFDNDNEYIVTFIYPFELKEHISSNEFKNSTPKFPEKKKELEKLANSLNENDNPVLMLVKLKE